MRISARQSGQGERLWQAVAGQIKAIPSLAQ
jgi:hypothetical protein